MHSKTLTAFVSLAALSASAGTASALDFHVSGDSWGVWVTDIFDFASSPNADGSTHYVVSDTGSGVAMDFDLTLPDGSRIDGSDITSRMVTMDIAGNIGDSSLELRGWSVWVEAFGLGVHYTHSSASDLTFTGALADGTQTYREHEPFVFYDVLLSVDNGDGTVDTVQENVTGIQFAALPSPGAASLLGLSGACALRRRRA